MADFLEAVERRSRPVADIEEGHLSTAACILANLSMQLGRSLVWDSRKGEVAGDREANRLLRPPYRSPWTDPEPGRVQGPGGLETPGIAPGFSG
jgi:hypothetical protein